MPSGFQQIFDPFIRSIGGEVIREGAQESADYLFRAEKVIAELKCLEEDPLDEHVRKLSALFESWGRRGQVRVFGTAVVELRRVPIEVQREWLNLLEAPIERVIRKANAQIRSSKEAEGLRDAKGLLLIVNDGNLLHTVPVEFMTLVARIFEKRSEDGREKFPHIRGVVYFSYRVPMAGESNPFWIPGMLGAVADPDLMAFEDKLANAWFVYYSRLRGEPCRVNRIPIPSPS